jgi:mRNA interferase MazF
MDRDWMEVRKGDICWIAPDGSGQIASDYTHPHVVLQIDPPHTVVVCALTSNLHRAKEPGNVLLDAGEANLPKQSVVLVSRTLKVNTAQLGDTIGTLTEGRIAQILAGIRFLQFMTQHHH